VVKIDGLHGYFARRHLEYCASGCRSAALVALAAKIHTSVVGTARLFTAGIDLSSDPELSDDQSIESLLQETVDVEEPQLPEEQDEEPKWSSDPVACMRRLEAVLFLARGPLTSRKLSQLAGLEDGTQARTMVSSLNQHYDQAGRAFHVKRVAGGYQMLTRPQFSKWIRRLEHVPKPGRFSAPMIETLSVVAYRQPIIKAEIEAIRGVSCGEILRQLLEKGLVKIAGRSPELGRPFLYATSKEFLTTFGLNSLDDLPRADRLAGTGLPQWASPTNPTLSDFEKPTENEHEKIADTENIEIDPVPDDQEE